MRKRIEITGKICIYNLSMSSVHQLMDVSYCVQCTAASPIGVLFGLEINLENGVENHNRRHLHRSVADMHACRRPYPGRNDGGCSLMPLHHYQPSPEK